MIIRKLYKFENAHIVRKCTSRRCSRSIHGHSYKVELFFTAPSLDRGEMVYDFGLTKGMIKDFIDAFDHAITLWSSDDPEYLRDMKKWSERWVELPVNPSAEQFARTFFLIIDRVLQQTDMVNGESDVTIDSVIVHETDTGYAKADHSDAYNEEMGTTDLSKIIFSDQVKAEWKNPKMFEELLDGKRFVNPFVA
ncbi:6-pyruvoyl trahydropterin synthase family protein [Hydrogenimonas thermophila]|uniref:6-carboxy-5,6,7,8-tetrahydropterin synthase n=1 Tax=Hydrogenimonas thermophila TaxID=223786 RepID=A0A1I5R3D9_9BACT|nr:6-carboxytetrahydropterin synthase [Hydrogenimonas thermophila]SFP53064.1 6-pyruvoyltetrahydropterin/6-carboxytetrahydropterin synthase [Hydrogenimonas thermophila]